LARLFHEAAGVAPDQDKGQQKRQKLEPNQDCKPSFTLNKNFQLVKPSEQMI